MAVGFRFSLMTRLLADDFNLRVLWAVDALIFAIFACEDTEVAFPILIKCSPETRVWRVSATYISAILATGFILVERIAGIEIFVIRSVDSFKS
nr:MAG TPA: hypothetical protein [Caudoviricetes sp.]